ncbi:MAG: C40 family peptidase [Lachnospiraceae bacterium]|nr:C40 family peptidase [Lachnospiraceae bacterium]
MNKKNIAVLTGCLAMSVIAGAGTIYAQSKTEKLSVYIPNAGIALALDNYDIEDDEKKAELSALIKHTVAATQEGTEEKTTEPMPETTTEPVTEEETTTEETTTEETTTEAPVETSVYDSIAMSQVDNYVNVRSLPSTDGEIVGKIYNNCAATILGTEGDWYKIESGNVTGYIKSEYFVTGEEAKAVAIQCGYVKATVTTETLNVRDGQGTDNRLLTQLPEGGEFDVIQYGDGWVYLNVDEDIQGWVSMDYVDIDVVFDTAITLEEEQAKLEEERRLAEEAAEAERIANEAREAEQRRKQEAAQQAAASQKETEQTTTTVNETYDTSTSAALRNAVVAYALQFVGNPYVYGGSSLTNGTDCSGFTMSVYAKFGYSLPHQSGSQSGCGTRVSLDSLLPGDLLFYSNGGSGIGHVALYIGNGQVVHASTPSTGIKISSANYRTPICAVRIIE